MRTWLAAITVHSECCTSFLLINSPSLTPFLCIRYKARNLTAVNIFQCATDSLMADLWLDLTSPNGERSTRSNWWMHSYLCLSSSIQNINVKMTSQLCDHLKIRHLLWNYRIEVNSSILLKHKVNIDVNRSIQIFLVVFFLVTILIFTKKKKRLWWLLRHFCNKHSYLFLSFKSCKSKWMNTSVYMLNFHTCILLL